MEIVEERNYEDRDGTKKYRKYRISKDEFLEETTHMECSQEYINNVIKPMNRISARQREKEEELATEDKEFRKWKKAKFGKK